MLIRVYEAIIIEHEPTTSCSLIHSFLHCVFLPLVDSSKGLKVAGRIVEQC